MARDHLCLGVAHGEAAAVAGAISGGVQLASRREADAEGAVSGQLRHEVQQSEGERRTQEEQGKKGGGRRACDRAASDTGEYFFRLSMSLKCTCSSIVQEK